MKFVVFSDLHLDAHFALHAREREIARRRRLGLRESLEQIVKLAYDVDADAILCGGDLYEHDRVTPDTSRFLQRIFGDISPTPVYIAPGNHDWLSSQSLYRRTAWSDNVQVFTNDRLEPVTLTDGVTLWGAAHCAPANTDGFLDRFTVPDRAGIHLGLFHGSARDWFAGEEEGKQPHAPFDPQQIAQVGLHHVFLGHYHRPRDAERHTYPGNPAPLAFGEDGDRGAVVVRLLADGRVIRARHRVATIDVHERAVDVTGCRDQREVRQRIEAATAGLDGLARVRLHGEISPDVQLHVEDLARNHPTLDQLMVTARDVRPAYDFQTIAREPTIRGQFVRDVQAAQALCGDERRRVLVTGLRALDGRIDLEVM